MKRAGRRPKTVLSWSVSQRLDLTGQGAQHLARLAIGMMMALRFCLSGFAAAPPHQGELLTKEGAVEFSGQRTNWVPAAIGLKLGMRDRLRTLALSRATLQLADLGRLRINELTTLEILPPKEATSRATLDLKAGALYFFTRDKPREFLLQMPHAIGASRGTEFLAVVEPSGRTVLTVFDGEVELSNSQGSIALSNGEQGTVEPGQAPLKTAVIQAVSIVQWWLYYPGVLATTELPLTAAERTTLAASLNAYNSGDLRSALENYPTTRAPQSEAERVFFAGLLLSVGQVDKAEALLAKLEARSPQADALREVIATVTMRPLLETRQPRLASEWLARSYSQQSTNLKAALQSARAAVEIAPSFGFGWVRVAELEFSFGRNREAEKALDRALVLAPHNPQALALRGFILSGQNQISEALTSFEQAIRIDGALGNAWLGRGLCRIRQGDPEGGRRDLQTAAALEPNRSLLRSYLAKAFSNDRDHRHAEQELALAVNLDAQDPTPWLYSSLLKFQQHTINEAVRDLEQSLELVDHRRVYRSRLLLDQDRAVRSASLAPIYQQAGMAEVSLREAARAVTHDYASYSAHLFLANSLDALRDPTRFNLRYETAWFNELLLANLLAPVGAGTFSQNISQQEYARLFEVDRLGFVSTTEVRSDGQYREVASQFGTLGRLSYSLDLDWQRNEGVRPNNELTRIEWYSQIKYQLTPEDSLFLLTKYQDYHSGDNFQYYDPDRSFRRDFNFDEDQTPLVLGAYHREWAPGVHTLFLGGRLINDQRLSDRAVPLLVLSTNLAGQTIARHSEFDVDYRSEFETYTAELSQIVQSERHNLNFGGRVQSGDFETHNSVSNVVLPAFFAPVNSRARDDFHRISLYAYHTWEVLDKMWITAGLAYDQVTFPENHRQVPVQEGEETRDEFGPKAALVWNPLSVLTVRGVYTRSLGGVSFDQSFRLEPTQLAGFSQSFRTIIPESVAGSVSAPSYETWGGGLDFKFTTHTYLGVQAEVLQSEVDRSAGVFGFDNLNPAVPSSTPQQLDYEERSVAVTINQLVSRQWALGAQYKFTRSELTTFFSALPSVVNPGLSRTESAELQQVNLYALFNHPSGFFARAEAQWYWQKNFGYTPPLPGDEFAQVNCFVGWRFPRQFGELSFGVLNLTDEDYRLNPLNVYVELPRERVYAGRLRLNF